MLIRVFVCLSNGILYMPMTDLYLYKQIFFKFNSRLNHLCACVSENTKYSSEWSSNALWVAFIYTTLIDIWVEIYSKEIFFLFIIRTLISLNSIENRFSPWNQNINTYVHFNSKILISTNTHGYLKMYVQNDEMWNY